MDQKNHMVATKKKKKGSAKPFNEKQRINKTKFLLLANFHASDIPLRVFEKITE